MEDLTPPVHKLVDRRATRCMLRISRSMSAGTFCETNRWRIWIWSDLHLGHRLSIGQFKRPFVDEEQMDEALHRAWRETVNPGDTLICLGDVALPGLWGRQLAKFRKAPARKILVFGNHVGDVDVEGFEEVHPTLYAGGEPPLLMTHMPLRHVPGRLRQCRWTHPQRCSDAHETRERERRADPVPAGRAGGDQASVARARGRKVPRWRDNGRTHRQLGCAGVTGRVTGIPPAD